MVLYPRHDTRPRLANAFQVLEGRTVFVAFTVAEKLKQGMLERIRKKREMHTR